MGAGADAEVVAEGPVVEVVPALLVRAGEGGGLVVGEAGGGQAGLDRVLHVGGAVVVGQRRRVVGEGGVGFEGEVVARQVLHAEADRRLQVGERHVQGLAGEGVHQVEVDALEVRARGFDRAPGLVAAVDAADLRQHGVVEALDAERQAIDAGGAVVAEACRLDRARVGLQGHLGERVERQQHADAGEERVERGRRHQAGGAAADEDAMHPPAPDLGQGVLQVGEHRVQPGLLRDAALARGVGVEVAVGALPHAPREMHVQGQRRRGFELRAFGQRQRARRGRGGGQRDDAAGGHGGRRFRCAAAYSGCEARRASRWRIAAPRWLRVFLSAASSSAAVCSSSGTQNSGS